MDPTDEALIESFRKTKDSSHFTSLVQRYHDRIYNAAYRMVGSSEEAEEVVQQTHIKVHENLGKFQRNSSFQSWLFRIVHNVSVDRLRASRRRRGFLTFDPQSSFCREDDYMEVVGQSAVAQVPDSRPSPSQELEMSEQGEVIADSLKQLPDNQRMVVILHDIEGFSYQEIADIVGANLGTVRSRLHYGRLRLRRLLEPYFSTRTISSTSR